MLLGIEVLLDDAGLDDLGRRKGLLGGVFVSPAIVVRLTNPYSTC